MSNSPEAFEEFKNSFSYGSRSDLAFKFLKALTPEDAADFFAGLLNKLGQSIDDGDLDRLVQHAYEWQVRAYAPQPGARRRWVYDRGPFARLSKPVAESRIGLVTSSGHFVDDPEPFGMEAMSQAEAEARIQEFLREPPELSEIPSHTPAQELSVRHGGYDVRAAQKDPGVVFPLQALRELETEGAIGELAPMAYSFVGATAQGRLLDVLPGWIKRFRAAELDAVVLVPV